MLYCLYKL